MRHRVKHRIAFGEDRYVTLNVKNKSNDEW